jgi:hypothetical protein
VSAVVSSLVAMPASALSIRRLSILASLGNCADGSRPSVDDVLNSHDIAVALDSPMDLQIDVAGDGVAACRGSSQRGTIVGDIAVTAMCVVAGALLTAAVHFWTRSDGAKWQTTRRQRGTTSVDHVIRAAARLRFPGMFFVLVTLFLQPIMTASVQLLAYGGPAADYAIGACGVVVAGLLMTAVTRVVDPRTRVFRAVAEAMDEDKLHNRRIRQRAGIRRRSQCMQLVAAVEIRWLALHEETNGWRARDAAGDGLFVERYGFLFESCREARHWWVLVEMWATIVLAALGGVVPPTSASCTAVAWLALSVCVLAFVACLVARPMSSVLESGIVVMLWASQVAMAACAVAGTADEAVAAIGIVSSALSCALAVLMVVTTVRNAQWDKELVALRLPTAAAGTRHARGIGSPSRSSTRGENLEVLLKMICDKHAESSLSQSSGQGVENGAEV